MSGKVVITERARYHETDASGFAGERAFVYWFDAARTACLRKYTDIAGKLKDGTLSLKTIELSINFSTDNDCNYDDEILIAAEPVFYESGAIGFIYSVTNKTTGISFAIGRTVHRLCRSGVNISRKELEELILKQDDSANG